MLLNYVLPSIRRPWMMSRTLFADVCNEVAFFLFFILTFINQTKPITGECLLQDNSTRVEFV